MQTLGLSPSTPKTSSRIRDLFWPRIDNEVAAVTAARNAMYASFCIAGFTAVFGLMARQNAWMWVDVVLYVMVGVGVRQLSRAAALVGFILYALAWLASPNATETIGALIRLIMLALLLGGVRAASFAFQQHRSDAVGEIANPPTDTTGMSRISILTEQLPKRFWPLVRAPFFILLFALVAMNLI